jgi:hypothetical protein
MMRNYTTSLDKAGYDTYSTYDDAANKDSALI